MEPEQAMSAPETVALNPQFRANEGALFHALLQATDYGILMTGLDRQDIVANRRLGEIFAMPPQAIVETGPDNTREHARALVRDPQAFDELLQRTYADPMLTYEDELELVGETPRVLRRFTGPVRDREGKPFGRIWTFEDITETKRLQAEVQAQLAARTEDFNDTSHVLKIMNDLCRIALKHASTEDLLAAVADRVRSLGNYESAAVLLLTKDGGHLEGVGYTPAGPVKPLRLSIQRDEALSRLLHRKQAQAEGPRTLITDDSGCLARKMKTKTLRMVPLRSQGESLGILLLGAAHAPQASSHAESYDTAHLLAVADQIAQTLETHRLQRELQTAMETLKATQQRMVEIEKLRTAGTLAASIAHDIRNILTTMQMELTMEPGVASEALYAQLNRFSALTHRLLAFSRPNVLETQPTSVGEVIHRIVPLIEGQAQINGVTIEIDLPRIVPPIAADASQLEHLFVNLCLNAIQAMTATGGTLTLRVRSTKHRLKVSVEDTGCGIAPEAIDRLFDPFFTTRVTGFGLGLFSCKRIVEEHGGQLSVVSTPGKGACFTMLLPVLPGKEAPKRPPKS
jgi:signal transduction histidine kinase